MRSAYRWEPCIVSRDADVDQFVRQYLGQSDRTILLVAGSGFDPRARVLADRLLDTRASKVAVLIKEERPNPVRELAQRAEQNEMVLSSVFPESELLAVDVFGSDGAVVGGRQVVSILSKKELGRTTDVVVDVSALSVGTSFPIVRYFVEKFVQGEITANVHLFVAHDPVLDSDIRSTASDKPDYVHGFRGGLTLSGSTRAARLWLPHLAKGRRAALTKLFDFVAPHDTCPVLPFPATNPRLGDELAAEYLAEIESTWAVDARNMVYADESDPLDLYRTILRLDDRRQRAFALTGGSKLVLSPLGSKVMGIGGPLGSARTRYASRLS